MKTLDICIHLFAGLGLFFVGINKVSTYMKELGGPYAKRVIGALTGSDLRAVFGGLISGLLTSSGKAVTFTIAGLSSGGALSLRQGLPIVIGGSIGSAFIVLWSSFDFKEVVLVGFGLVGLYYQFGDMKDETKRAVVGVMLGFVLLFYGLDFIRSGALPIKELPWFDEFVVETRDNWPVALLMGALGAFVSQSGSSVAIIAIPLVSTGLLNMNQAIMLVFGTNLGSGICTGLLGASMSGMARKLVLFHAFIKSVGVFLLVPLLYLEAYGHVPLLKHLVAFLTPALNTQLALVYLFYELITGIVVWGAMDGLSRYLGRDDEEFAAPDQQLVPAELARQPVRNRP